MCCINECIRFLVFNDGDGEGEKIKPYIKIAPNFKIAGFFFYLKEKEVSLIQRLDLEF